MNNNSSKQKFWTKEDRKTSTLPLHSHVTHENSRKLSDLFRYTAESFSVTVQAEEKNYSKPPIKKS